MTKEVVKREQSSDTDFLDFDLTTVIMPVIMIALLLSMAQQMQTQTQILQAQAYHGVEDTRILNATGSLQWINLIHNYPFRPWISAYFINDGPSPVEIGINYPDKTFTMNPYETITVNRSGALDERILIIYYRCSLGARASVRVTGTY